MKKFVEEEEEEEKTFSFFLLGQVFSPLCCVF